MSIPFSYIVLECSCCCNWLLCFVLYEGCVWSLRIFFCLLVCNYGLHTVWAPYWSFIICLTRTLDCIRSLSVFRYKSRSLSLSPWKCVWNEFFALNVVKCISINGMYVLIYLHLYFWCEVSIFRNKKLFPWFFWSILKNSELMSSV